MFNWWQSLEAGAQVSAVLGVIAVFFAIVQISLKLWTHRQSGKENQLRMLNAPRIERSFVVHYELYTSLIGGFDCGYRYHQQIVPFLKERKLQHQMIKSEGLKSLVSAADKDVQRVNAIGGKQNEVFLRSTGVYGLQFAYLMALTNFKEAIEQLIRQIDSFKSHVLNKEQSGYIRNTSEWNGLIGQFKQLGELRDKLIESVVSQLLPTGDAESLGQIPVPFKTFRWWEYPPARMTLPEWKADKEALWNRIALNRMEKRNTKFEVKMSKLFDQTVQSGFSEGAEQKYRSERYGPWKFD